MLRFRRTDPHTLAGAYALDALGDADRARFERHLSGCPSCAQEARGLQEATSRLADTLATAPPPGMRERVMAAAARTRQNPPVDRDAPCRVAGPGGVAGPGWMAGPRRAAMGDAGRRGRWPSPWCSAASCSTPSSSSTRMRDGSHAIAAVLNEPDAAMMTVTATTRGSATIVMSHRARALVFTAARLPALPSSQRYELWLMGLDGPRAAGMLPLAARGDDGPGHRVGPAIGRRVRGVGRTRRRDQRIPHRG